MGQKVEMRIDVAAVSIKSNGLNPIFQEETAILPRLKV
jgi:hypothetical protein